MAETFPNKLVLVGETGAPPPPSPPIPLRPGSAPTAAPPLGYPSEDDSPLLSPAKCRWCSDANQRHFLEALFFLADQKKVPPSAP